MIPFNNPFNNNFYKIHKHNDLNIGIRKNTFGDLFVNRFLFDYKKHYYKTELDILEDIKKSKLDYGIVSLETLSAIKKYNYNNVQFIASLVYSYVNILAKNNVNINLTYNTKYNRKYYINVIYENSIHHLSCKKILKYLEIEDYFEFMFISKHDDPKLIKMDILYYIGVHPIKYIKNVLKIFPMHYINLNFTDKYKNDFIHMYKYYLHDLINLHDVKFHYPNLTIINKNINYIKTIKTMYILISSDKVEFNNMDRFFKIKKQIMFTQEYYFDKMNELSLIQSSYNPLNINYNTKAKEYYEKIKIHNNNKDWNYITPPEIPPLLYS